MGVVCVRVLCQSSVFPRIHAPILPDKLQKITKCFQCDYKTKTKLKHRTHYAIFQNRRICASCQIIWLGALCGLCILPYIHCLRSCACWCGSLGCLCVLGLCGRWVYERSKSVQRFCVFVSVDVKYIIRYRCVC